MSDDLKDRVADTNARLDRLKDSSGATSCVEQVLINDLFTSLIDSDGIIIERDHTIATLRAEEMDAQFWEWQVANVIAYIDEHYPELAPVIEMACGSKEALAKAARDRE